MNREHNIVSPFETSLLYLLKDTRIVLSATSTATFHTDYQNLSVRFIQVISSLLNKLTQYIPDTFYTKFDAIVQQLNNAISKNKRQVFRQSKQPQNFENYTDPFDQIQIFLNKGRNYAKISDQHERVHRKSVDNLQSYIQLRQSKQKHIKSIIGFGYQPKTKQYQKVNTKVGSDQPILNVAHIATQTEACKTVQYKKFRTTCNSAVNQFELQEVQNNRHDKKIPAFNKTHKNFRRSLELNQNTAARAKAITHSRSKQSKSLNRLKQRTSIGNKLQTLNLSRNSKRETRQFEEMPSQSRIKMRAMNVAMNGVINGAINGAINRTMNGSINRNSYKKTESWSQLKKMPTLETLSDLNSNNLIRQNTIGFDQIRQSAFNIISGSNILAQQYYQYQGIQQQQSEFSSQNIISSRVIANADGKSDTQKENSQMNFKTEIKQVANPKLAERTLKNNQPQKERSIFNRSGEKEARKTIAKTPLKILDNKDYLFQARNSHKAQKSLNDETFKSKHRSSFGISIQGADIIKMGKQINLKKKSQLA